MPLLNRRLRIVLVNAIGIYSLATMPMQAEDADRPNILWITAEDMSPALGCYGDAYATTPNIDKFAQASVLYTNAYAASPVCSPSRACLITGMYPASLGAHQMRSQFPLPEGVKGFPAYLREVGYFTTNNVKTDYNVGDIQRVIRESWNQSSDKAHWRNPDRAPGQPFFSVFNDMTSHQSRTMVWPYPVFQEHVQSRLDEEEIHDPANAPLPPYYPDTPVIRKTVARFYDCVTVMDTNVGRILQQLEEDGLAEDTIVFFYSDHGSGMPRHKRLLYDSGMRVALIIRFPEKYRHLAPGKPGTRTDQLVSFVDFPATVLRLAGLEPPDSMQGKAFLGPEAEEPRQYVYGSRDRVDEVHEMARSLRDKDYLYIRNYMPFLSHNQPSAFPDLGEIREEFYRLAHPEILHELTEPQLEYAGPTKPMEAFYDVVHDPHQVQNLLEGEMTSEQEKALERFRAEFVRYRSKIKDLGALPEDEMWSWIEREEKPLRDIVTRQTGDRPDLAGLWSAADLVGSEDTARLEQLLEKEDPGNRFWGVLALRQADYAHRHRLAPLLNDPAPSVRIETAHFLAYDDFYQDQAIQLLIEELDNEDWWSALRACRAIELLGQRAEQALPAMKALYKRTRHSPGDGNFYLSFSAGAWLDAMGEPIEPWDFSPGAGSFSADPETEEG